MELAILVPTLGEKTGLLSRALESYLGQTVAVSVYVSTIMGDPSARPGALPSACTVLAMDPADHPGRGPSGIMSQITFAVDRLQKDGIWGFCYMSGNDEAEPTKIEHEFELLQSTGAHIAVSAYSRIDETMGGRREVRYPPSRYDPDVTRRRSPVTDCAFVTLEHWSRMGGLRLEFGNWAYHDFWWRSFEEYGESVFAYNPRIEWTYYITEDSQHVRRRSDPNQTTKVAADWERMLRSHDV